VEPNGEMLIQEWEKYATELVNAEGAYNVITEIMETEKINSNNVPRLIVGRDTRQANTLLYWK
jgi:hypothetical protein